MKRLKMWMCHTLGHHHLISIEADDWCDWGSHWADDAEDPGSYLRSY